MRRLLPLAIAGALVAAAVAAAATPSLRRIVLAPAQVGTGGQGTIAAQVRLGLHAAEEGAENLRRLA